MKFWNVDDPSYSPGWSGGTARGVEPHVYLLPNFQVAVRGRDADDRREEESRAARKRDNVIVARRLGPVIVAAKDRLRRCPNGHVTPLGGGRTYSST